MIPVLARPGQEHGFPQGRYLAAPAETPDVIPPALDAVIGAWRTHVRRLSDAYLQAQGADDRSYWRQALSQAAQAYVMRRFEMVRDEEGLLAVHSLALRLADHADLDCCTEALIKLSHEFAKSDARLSEYPRVDAAVLCDFVRAFSCNGRLCQEAGAARRALAEEVGHRLEYDGNYFSDSQQKALREGFAPGDPAEAAAIGQLPGMKPAWKTERRADAWQAFEGHPSAAAHGRAAQDRSGRQLGELAKRLGRDPRRAENRTAMGKLAREIAGMGDALMAFAWWDLTNLANGCAKFVEKERRASLVDDGLAAIAEAVIRRRERDGLEYASAVDVSLLANAFSKLADDGACDAALVLLAGEVQQRSEELKHFAALHLSNLANAFSKLAGEAGGSACDAALALLAGEVQRRSRKLKDFGIVAVSNLANAFSKLSGEAGAPACDAALVLLAGEVQQRSGELKHFSVIAVSNLANAFSKLSGEAGDPACNAALVLLAGEVQQRSGKLKNFKAMELSSLVNAFSKLAGNPECRDAAAGIALHLSSMEPEQLKAQLSSMKSPGTLCNALGLFARLDAAADEDPGRQPVGPFVEALEKTSALMLAMAPESWITGLIDFALTLHGLHQAGLASRMRQVALHAWPRLFDLLGQGALHTASLEAAGALSRALLPLIHSRAAPDLRKKALSLLVREVLPAAWRKVALHAGTAAATTASSSSAPSTATENFRTRIPEHSYYCIARASADAARFWTRRNTTGHDRQGLHDKRQELMQQGRLVWQHLDAIRNGDISGYSWNLIAQLEAESPGTILDDFVRQHWDDIRHQPAPARFDWHAVFDDMSGEPAPPAPGKGIVNVPRSDFAGRTPRDAGASQPRYSILARLAGGELPLLQVDLPSVLTPFLLGRAVHYQGVAYRVDLTGGSAMKPGRKTVEDSFAQAAGQHGAVAGNSAGKLYALRVADTGRDTSFARLMEQLFPYTEAYYYFQRALMSSPPAIAAAHGPAAHVLEGRFRIGVLPDRIAGEHPFRLQDAGGRPLALQPHDGLGFIRESLARRFAWYQDLTGPDSAAFGGTARQANLPPDALQHYARDASAAVELAGTLPQGLDGVELYRRLTQGMHGKGHIAKAVPASGRQVVLPASKRCDSHLLLGRAPYETAKLQAVPDADVLRGADATARFLDASPWLQYSFVCRRQDQSLSFFKGGLLVVPDAQWPKEHADRHLVFSAEDEKSRSGWRDGKARHREDAAFDCAAMLAVTEAFGPGSCAAVPLPLQKAMGGDYDGDDVLLVSGMPALHGLVQRHQRQHATPELKLPKTHTPAYGEHGYYLGRSAQIAATRLNLLGRFTVLQRRLLVLPVAAQEQLARDVLEALCREGLDKTLEAEIEALLDAPDRRHADAQRKAAALASELDRRAQDSHGAAARGWFSGLAADVRALAGAPGRPVDMAPLQQLAALPEWPADPGQRLALWLEHLPSSGPPLPAAVWQAHLQGAHLEGLRRLLMLGIKAGEDAYKSDTGVRAYDRIGRKLERLLGQHGIAGVVPYTRHTMHLLLRRHFDDEQARRFQVLLAQAPNQAAAVMEHTLGQWRELRQERQWHDLEAGQRSPAPASANGEASSAIGEPASASASGRKRGRGQEDHQQEQQERRVRPRAGDRKGEDRPEPETPGRAAPKRPREEEQERRVRQRTDALAGQASGSGALVALAGSAVRHGMPDRPGVHPGPQGDQ